MALRFNERSRVKKPIVFYLDRNTPEPIRSAVLEGSAWWSQAFDTAGFINAYRVEMLPEGADPLDVRFNMINWVDPGFKSNPSVRVSECPILSVLGVEICFLLGLQFS